MTSNWDDGNVFALFRSPFLLPSIILHVLLMLLAVRAANLSLARPAQDPPITVQLAEFKGLGSDTKSVGPAKGPGGPRELPKLGTPIAPAPRTGKVESPSVESPLPAPAVEAPPPPKPVALPGPKVLAANTRSDSVNANETAPDSLVRLPTKAAPTLLPGAAATESPLTQNNGASVKAAEGAAIKGLNETGGQIPGALRGSGSGTGPLGVPGGSRTGTGLAGGGTGSGAGGGGRDGLKGASNLDFNRYLEQLEKRVKSVWKYPEEVAGVQEVAVRFALDRAGKLIQAQVLDSSDARLNTSAIDAMKRASPFPPIPESLAKELANEPLIVRFRVSIRVRG